MSFQKSNTEKKKDNKNNGNNHSPFIIPHVPFDRPHGRLRQPQRAANLVQSRVCVADGFILRCKINDNASPVCSDGISNT